MRRRIARLTAILGLAPSAFSSEHPRRMLSAGDESGYGGSRVRRGRMSVLAIRNRDRLGNGGGEPDRLALHDPGRLLAELQERGLMRADAPA